MARKATATIHWELSEDDDIDISIIKKQLESFLPSSIKIKKVNLDSAPKQKQHKMKVLGEFGLKDVFDKVGENKVEFKINKTIHYVKMNSQRYFVFKENHECVCCGLKGEVFLLEKHPNDKVAHFNLYAIEDGELILMTKDHILAKSSGGEDRHYNYQTMCSVCNNLKGADNITLQGLLELRKFHKEFKFKLTKRNLNDKLNSIRKKNIHPENDEIKKDNTIVLSKTDMHIMESPEGNLLAISVYESQYRCKDWKHIGSIKKGFPVYDVQLVDNKVMISFGDKTCEVYKGQFMLG